MVITMFTTNQICKFKQYVFVQSRVVGELYFQVNWGAFLTDKGKFQFIEFHGVSGFPVTVRLQPAVVSVDKYDCVQYWHICVSDISLAMLIVVRMVHPYSIYSAGFRDGWPSLNTPFGWVG